MWQSMMLHIVVMLLLPTMPRLCIVVDRNLGMIDLILMCSLMNEYENVDCDGLMMDVDGWSV